MIHVNVRGFLVREYEGEIQLIKVNDASICKR